MQLFPLMLSVMANSVDPDQTSLITLIRLVSDQGLHHLHFNWCNNMFCFYFVIYFLLFEVLFSNLSFYILISWHKLPYLVCLFDLGLTSLSTIFQSYCDGVWMWQGAQCSLLECCLIEISCPRHFDMIFHPVTLYWHWADQLRFLALLS